MNSKSIQLPPELCRKIRSAAKRRKTTPELFVVSAVEAELATHSKSREPSLFDRASDLCGSVSGGPIDLARNPSHLKGYGTWKR